MDRRVGIVGYGRFGRAFGLLLVEAGMEVKCFDPRASVPSDLAATSPAALVADSDLIVLAVPLSALSDAAEELVPFVDPSRHVVVDVTSAKAKSTEILQRTLGTRVPWVATHPLFGAASIASSERPLTALVCPHELHREATSRVITFFEALGCDVVRISPEEHDVLIARTQSVAFFIAKALADAALTFDARLVPPSMRGFVRTLELMRGLEGHVLRTVASEIPESAVARARLRDAMAKIEDELQRGADPSGGADSPPPLPAVAPPDLTARSPLLRQTREAIDAIDRRMLELLAQRARLSVRAASAKAELGHGVFDGTREAQLLAERRTWAVEQKLDPDTIDGVFSAILKFSRGLQR